MKRQIEDPRFLAAYDMIRRTGAATIDLRYQDDQQPVVWISVATYARSEGKPARWECAAGHDPVEAVLRLCEALVDGAKCVHCGHGTIFYADLEADLSLEAAAGLCTYMWDPELATFRRGCEDGNAG